MSASGSPTVGKTTGRPATIGNEFAKMRRLWVAPVTAAMVAAIWLLSVAGLGSKSARSGFSNPAAHPWETLLMVLCVVAPLVSPIVIAVLASRQVDIEHQGHGWLLAETSGVGPGQLCRAKFVAVGAVLGAATLSESVLVAAAGRVAGISVAFPWSRWASYTACLLLVNLVVLAFHLVVAARVDNQLVGLGLGVLGAFVAVFSLLLPEWVPFAVAPWGYYALSMPVTFQQRGLVLVTPPYPAIGAAAFGCFAVFLLVTARFDRAER